MADAKGIADQIAGFFSGGSEPSASPEVCPTCGKPKDDVPEPGKKGAEKFSKAFNESGAIAPSDAWKNLKKSVGY